MEKHLEMAMESVKTLIATMRNVIGFKIRKSITTMVEDVALAIEEGRNSDAIAKCSEIVRVGRSILGQFIRHSVIEYTVLDEEDNKVAMEPHFGKEIRLRSEEGYHQDLLDRMKKFMRELEEAVRTETGADFTRRIACYNAMKKVLDETFLEQERRDKKLQLQQEMEMKYGKKVKSSKRDDNTPDAELQRQQQRQKVLEKRAETANSFRSIL